MSPSCLLQHVQHLCLEDRVNRLQGLFLIIIGEIHRPTFRFFSYLEAFALLARYSANNLWLYDYIIILYMYIYIYRLSILKNLCWFEWVSIPLFFLSLSASRTNNQEIVSANTGASTLTLLPDWGMEKTSTTLTSAKAGANDRGLRLLPGTAVTGFGCLSLLAAFLGYTVLCLRPQKTMSWTVLVQHLALDLKQIETQPTSSLLQ